jgi:F-type H+-transporting ATPase subunit a
MTEQFVLKPLDQFNIQTLVDFKIGGYSFGLTNSVVFMLVALLCGPGLLLAFIRNPKIVPGKLQAFGEIVHDFVLGTLNENTLGKGEKYFPFIFSMFCFILMLNALGLVPHSFTVTSHISVTLALALIVFVVLNVIAFSIHGLKFFHFFLPHGIPVLLAPIMVIIEMFVYLIRPLTLSIRLAANMIAGHILLYVAASFIVMSGMVVGIIPIPFVIAFTGFEIFVAILQAYIFTILTCTYLNDAIHLH